MNPILIAEIAKAHHGDMTRAIALLEDAAMAKPHAVKYQMYSLDDLNPEHANYHRYRECYLTMKKVLTLRDLADQRGLDFYVSCFSIGMLPKIAKHFTKIKVPSTFLTYTDFIKVCLDNFKEVHISTGMHRFDVAIKILDYYRQYKTKDTIMIPYHCVSLYPTPVENLKLCRVSVLRNRYGIVGYSDHSVTNKACMLAAHAGADFIEKHYAFNEMHQPWCWTNESLRAFNASLRNEAKMVKDVILTQQEKDNFEFYKQEFKGINNCHLRLLTS